MKKRKKIRRECQRSLTAMLAGCLIEYLGDNQRARGNLEPWL